MGFAPIGNVTFESAAYVARYMMKKRKGKDKEKIAEHYKLLDQDTGEIHQLNPEFCLMSRRPGLGKDWLEKYKTDTDKDFLTIRGTKYKLPKYYDNILEIEDKIQHEERRFKRLKSAQQRKEDNTIERLFTKEKVKEAQLKQLKRDFET